MGHIFSATGRGDSWRRLKEETYDVLIVGGGITGAGIALDAQTRGMKTALIDMQDFAAGTSSRSTKLVHGGLRYLKQFEVKMVAEVGKERAVVYENGPHVTTPEWMLLPIYQGGTFGRWSTSVGLRVYDWLAGVRRGERRKMLGKEETAAKEPLLRRQGMQGGGYYVEYRTDDARLTIEVLKKAAAAGVDALNYVRADKLVYDGDGRAAGVEAADLIGGSGCTIRARQVVNATGPWVDALRELDGSRHGKTLRLTKGVHLVFDGGRFPLRQAVYFDTPDGRMVFAIPRDGKTYVGTTDTDYAGDTAHPRISAADRDYLLRACNDMFPELKLERGDVESGWAGLRPLIYEEGKSPSEVSRRDEIFVSHSGLVTIAGGKLTGYRKMAETVTDRLAAALRAAGCGPYRPCGTRTMPLSGGDVGGSGGYAAFVREATAAGERAGLPRQEAERIAARYGSNAGAVFERVGRWQTAGDGGRHGLSAGDYAALLYAIEEEMAVKPVDYMIRRTGALLFDIDWVRRHRDGVVALMAECLGYGSEELAAYEEELDRELAAVRCE
ncbi:glycerol-3-phosphate dehydrogenase/oxidase [Cohnella sp. 56]|uniref:glycerol-3-phosphate dehydrogenase/oxidase n=1 Tax=Cohnella sp. 56 TaxID=3113722 RepID=UPI0030E83EDD